MIPINKPRDATLCFLVKGTNGVPEKICLAMKKRGFGVGKWNGVGGKVDEGETIEEAVIRETMEEINVTPKNLKKVANISFFFPAKSEWDQNVHVYLTTEWEGEPQESEEMQPQWFVIDEIPYDSMWEAAVVWLPKVLLGEKIRANFNFEGDTMLDYALSLVEDSEL